MRALESVPPSRGRLGLRLGRWLRLRRWLGLRRWLPSTAVFGVAFVARLGIVLASSGGIRGSTSYDPGVYYAASAALLAGRMPYRDFTLIHPPAGPLVLSPFALIGRYTSDHTGFIAAQFGVMVIGATCALLVHHIAKQLGFGTRAALVGGLFYAVFYPSLGSEYAARLEPVGNLFVLLGVAAFVHGGRYGRLGRRSGGARWAVLAGAALGAAASTKIWYVVPLVVIALWVLVERRGPRAFLLTVIGATGAGLLINGPFFVLAPRAMFHAVTLDQLGRGLSGTGPRARLAWVAGLTGARIPLTPVVAALTAMIGAALIVLAWRVAGGRLPVVLLGAEVCTLVLSPSWFPFYADYAVTGAALTVAAAAAVRIPKPEREGRSARVRLQRRVWVLPAAVVLVATALTVLTDVVRPIEYLRPFPDQRLAAAVRDARCVQSDEPMTLIALNVLTRDLRNGCQLWVDVTGRTYGVDRRVGPSGVVLPRQRNAVWQRDLSRYLLSGDAVVVTRAVGSGISAATMRRLTRGRLLVTAGGVRAYATGSSQASSEVAERRSEPAAHPRR